MSKRWSRECENCGTRQYAFHPEGYKNDSWTDVKCRHCGLPDLNYGSYDYTLYGAGKTAHWLKSTGEPVSRLRGDDQ